MPRKKTVRKTPSKKPAAKSDNPDSASLAMNGNTSDTMSVTNNNNLKDSNTPTADPVPNNVTCDTVNGSSDTMSVTDNDKSIHSKTAAADPVANDDTSDTMSTSTSATDNDNSDNSQNIEAPIPQKMPVKRDGATINIMGARRNKRNNNGKNRTNITLGVEGYAFQDDVIGVAHVRSDGEDAFNMTLRNLVASEDIRDSGFSMYVTLRDKQSGKDDDHLRGKDGYPKYLFMSINIHKFSTTKEAAPAVLQQCNKLLNVRLFLVPIFSFFLCISTFFHLVLYQIATLPHHNIFGYKYDPVTAETNKTGKELLVLSDLIRYSDAHRILKSCYGDNTYEHKLEEGFGKKYPEIIKKYFSNVDDIPDRIREDLGL